MISKTISGVLVPFAKGTLNKNIPSMVVCPRRLSHNHSPPAHYRPPTMDELPVPCGSWKEHYENNQRKYNIHLLLGSGFFLITFVVGVYSGALDMYLLPPDQPAPRAFK